MNICLVFDMILATLDKEVTIPPPITEWQSLKIMKRPDHKISYYDTDWHDAFDDIIQRSHKN